MLAIIDKLSPLLPSGLTQPPAKKKEQSNLIK
jgi:hypothetical protein